MIRVTEIRQGPNVMKLYTSVICERM